MQKLYDSDARLLGYLAETAAGRRVLYDANFRVRGYYYPATDKTYDADIAPRRARKSAHVAACRGRRGRLTEGRFAALRGAGGVDFPPRKWYHCGEDGKRRSLPPAGRLFCRRRGF